MARSYSGVIADTSLAERLTSVRHAENTVSNKGMNQIKISSDNLASARVKAGEEYILLNSGDLTQILPQRSTKGANDF